MNRVSSDNGSLGANQQRVRRPASIAPSISSVLSDATTITAPAHEQRGFKSREAYLAALNEFAESKLYMPAGDHTLQGWYGVKTMDDYKNRPGLRSGRDSKKKRNSRRSNSSAGGVEGSTVMPVISETSDAVSPGTEPRHEECEQNRGSVVGKPEKQGRLRRLSRVFSVGNDRRATIS